MNGAAPTVGPSTRRTVRMAGAQLLAEQRMFWRNPGSYGFTLVFPLLMLVVLCSVYADEPVRAGGRELDYATYYLPGVVTLATAMCCFTGLATTLVLRRDNGNLKRKRGTPLPNWLLLSGILTTRVALALLMTALTAALAVWAYGVPAPERPWLLGTAALSGAVTLGVLGFAVTVLVPNADAAQAVLNLLLFALLFLSGVFFPVGNDLLRALGEATPVGALRGVLLESVTGHAVGRGVVGGHPQAVLAAWTLLGAVCGLRWFRWEPRRG